MFLSKILLLVQKVFRQALPLANSHPFFNTKCEYRAYVFGLSSALLVGCSLSPYETPADVVQNDTPTVQLLERVEKPERDLFTPGRILAAIPDNKDTLMAAAFLQALDQQLVDQAREAAGLSQTLGDQASSILARLDRARAQALNQLVAQSVQGKQEQPSTSQLIQTVAWNKSHPLSYASAQTNPSIWSFFITTMSPEGIASKVLDWEKNYQDEFPASEKGVDIKVEGVNTKVVVFKRLEGDRLLVDVKLTQSILLPNPPGGTLTETLLGRISQQLCPDQAGKVKGDFTIEVSSQIGSDYSGGMKIQSAITGRVNDEANLVSYEERVLASKHGTAISESGDRKGYYGEIQVSVSMDKGSRESWEFSHGEGEELRRSSKMTDEGIRSLAEVAVLFAHWLARDTLKEAEMLWRNSFCVEVTVIDPPSSAKERVSPGSQLPFTAEARHRWGGGIVEAPIEAWLKYGETAVTPTNQPIPSPATFTYTAPSKSYSGGTIQLRTVSKRGIGEGEAYFNTFPLEFIVRGTATAEGKDTSDPYRDYTYQGGYRARFSLVIKSEPEGQTSTSPYGLYGTGTAQATIFEDFHDAVYNCSSNVTAQVNIEVFGILRDGGLWIFLRFESPVWLPYVCWFSNAPIQAPFAFGSQEQFEIGDLDMVTKEYVQYTDFGTGENDMLTKWKVEVERATAGNRGP